MPDILKVLNVYKSFSSLFSKISVLKELSFSLNKGEIFGFIGPNGAGKTTTIKILVGLLNPDKGKVEVFQGSPQNENIRKKIGFLPEQPYFYEHLTGFEFLDYTARLYQLRNKKERIEYWLNKVGLYEHRKNYLRTYSRGMLQRIGIANALISEPCLLILDEPLSGLDPVGRKEMKELIYEQKKNGKTVFFSSHILPDAEEICDRVGIISQGKILRIGALSEILNQEIRPVEITVRNLNIEKLPNRFFSIEKIGEETVIRVLSEDIEKTLKYLLSFNEIKIISVKPIIYSLEEWFFKFLKGGFYEK